MKHILLAFILLLLTACAHRNPLSDMSFQTVMAPPYVLASWYKIENPGDTLKVYIEGDGNAFDQNGVPTDNPTPTGEFMRQLAAKDPSPNVAYLGRPCQYLQTGACTQKDWTSGRFSEAIIKSMDTSVQALMKKAKADQAILIGFSGGAQVAGLVAVRHPEKIKQVVTIAGVLDVDAWTNYHGDAPLSESLNLKTYQDQFFKLNQIHYVGGKDCVVPPKLVQDFIQNNASVIVVPKASHGKGFEKIYDAVYQIK